MGEVGDALVLIADKLGIGVTEVYRILVEAQAYQGILNLISTGVFVLSSFIIGHIIYNKLNGPKDDKLFAGVLVGAFSGFIVGFIVWVFGRALMHIMMPEYTALTELLNIIER